MAPGKHRGRRDDRSGPPSGRRAYRRAALTSDHAWIRLSELCDGIGHRLSGSASLERAVVWARDAMRADGLDSVWLQPVQVPAWVRGRESARLVEPRDHPLSILGLGRSVGTPRGGLTAEVVVVRSFDELEALPADRVRGKIVLYNVPFTSYGQTVRYRTRGANRASRRGAVASLVRSVGPVSLRTPHTGNMSAYNDSFPRIPAAAVTIEDAEMIARLIARDQRVRLRLEMEADTLLDAPSHNVIGELRGRESPDDIVVIGGHLDSWDVGQGAHDDGGGCVIAMEALRLLSRLDLRPRRTLRCVLWTNEENGTRGGKAYAKTYGTSQRHVAAVESDGGVERVVERPARSDLLSFHRTAPNPFEAATTISFGLAREARVDLSVYDLNGRLVTRLIDGVRGPGRYDTAFDGSSLGAGVYFYRLRAYDQVRTGRLLRVR